MTSWGDVNSEGVGVWCGRGKVHTHCRHVNQVKLTDLATPMPTPGHPVWRGDLDGPVEEAGGGGGGGRGEPGGGF